jgi:DNA topoisomerase-1
MPPKRFFKKSTNTIAPISSASRMRSYKWLVIVESPSKCAKIEEYLGELEFDPVFGGKYACIASKGHIRTIDGLKSINTKTDFAPTFSIIDGKSRHICEMREHIKAFSKENILIATDDDREGEAIGWHICQVFDLPPETTKRILFHEITKQAICDAVKNPTVLNMSLIYAQHSRQVLDMVVGYTISPILWKHIYNDKLNGLSAGRCQTPALRLIYDHSQEYKAQPLEYHYKTSGVFFDKNIRFELSHAHDTEEELLRFMELSKTHRYTLELMPCKETYKSPPKPFTTSRLLQSASSALKCSPKKTMELCQQLYQSGLITYMRTDSSKYSPVFLQQIETYIQQEWADPKYIGNLIHLANQDGANPHEAIRVTNIKTKTISTDDRSLASMYRFIWKNTLESCMSVAKYNSRLVKISAPTMRDTPTQSPYYGYTLEIPIFLGWKIVSGPTEDGETDTKTDIASQQTGLQFYFESFLTQHTNVRVNYIESRVVAEHRNPHYTEASLIQRLEELGIGRPSTYASIVETIQERGYVKKTDIKGQVIHCNEYKLRFEPTLISTSTLEKTKIEKAFGTEKGKLMIVPTGVIVLEFLIQYFERLFSYDYTKNMELSLDRISETDAKTAEITWSSICSECYQLIKQLKKPLTKIQRETYTLDKNTELVFHSNGASIKQTDEDGNVVYRTVKKSVEIDLGKLKNGEYSVDANIFRFITGFYANSATMDCHATDADIFRKYLSAAATEIRNQSHADPAIALNIELSTSRSPFSLFDAQAFFPLIWRRCSHLSDDSASHTNMVPCDFQSDKSGSRRGEVDYGYEVTG